MTPTTLLAIGFGGAVVFHAGARLAIYEPRREDDREDAEATR